MCLFVRYFISISLKLDIPSEYYPQVQPDAEIVQIVHGLDIPVVLGQATFLQIVWNLTRVQVHESCDP